MVTHNIKPTLGATRLQKLTTKQIQAVWKKLMIGGNAYGGGLELKTIRNIHSCLSAALRHAKLHRLVDSVETIGVRLLKVERTELNILSRSQSMELIEALEGHWLQPIVIVALTTGIRVREILGLKWSNVPLDKGTIRICWSLSETKKHGLKLKRPKTRSGERTISLSSVTIDALRKVLVDQNERSLRLGVGKSNDALVFDGWCRANGKHGEPMPPHYVTTEFIRRINKVDVPRVQFHDLRHTHISQLLLDGHPVKIVSTRAGHKSAHMTLDIYGHLLPSSDRDMMVAFDKKLEQVKVQKRPIMADLWGYFCGFNNNPLNIR